MARTVRSNRIHPGLINGHPNGECSGTDYPRSHTGDSADGVTGRIVTGVRRTVSLRRHRDSLVPLDLPSRANRSFRARPA